MRKIVQYKAVVEGDWKDFEEQANLLIKEGFEPFGSLSCFATRDYNLRYLQSFVRYMDMETYFITQLQEGL